LLSKDGSPKKNGNCSFGNHELAERPIDAVTTAFPPADFSTWPKYNDTMVQTSRPWPSSRASARNIGGVEFSTSPNATLPSPTGNSTTEERPYPSTIPWGGRPPDDCEFSGLQPTSTQKNLSASPAPLAIRVFRSMSPDSISAPPKFFYKFLFLMGLVLPPPDTTAFHHQTSRPLFPIRVEPRLNGRGASAPPFLKGKTCQEQVLFDLLQRERSTSLGK